MNNIRGPSSFGGRAFFSYMGTTFVRTSYNMLNLNERSAGMENKHQVEPLLYIDQPLFQKPVVFMQRDYKGNLKGEDTGKEKDIKHSTENDDSMLHFNARSLEGKIHYLLHLPKEMPHLKCEVRTKDKVYVGKIVNELDDTIEISMFGKPNYQLNKNAIEGINLIGF